MPDEMVKPDVVLRLEAAGFDILNKKRDRALCMLLITANAATHHWGATGVGDQEQERKLSAFLKSLEYLGFESFEVDSALEAIMGPEEEELNAT